MTTNCERGWEVVLRRDLAARARETAHEVATRLRAAPLLAGGATANAGESERLGSAVWEPPTLAQGHPGLALACGCFDSCFPGEGWDEAAQRHLELAARAMEDEDELELGLFSGLAGLGFAALVLSEGGRRYTGLIGAVEEALLPGAQAVADRLRAGGPGCPVERFDVVSGLAGIGAYLLARGSDPDASTPRVAILEGLVGLAADGAPLPAWHTPAELLDPLSRERYPGGWLNCGLAHGIPGPLALLALAETAGLGVGEGAAAIDAIARWLAERRLDDEWGVNWPPAIPLGGGAIASSRTAWCYGSPGVARSLWLAGEALQDSGYRELAVEAMAAVYRRPVAARRIDSPTFCHGLAGLLQITLRFAADTGLPLFRDAATTLARQLVAAYEPASLFGFRDLGPDGWRDDPALLSGAAGVALVLLAASSPVEPSWDRVFLLS
jgi:hypothetical protein